MRTQSAWLSPWVVRRRRETAAPDGAQRASAAHGERSYGMAGANTPLARRPGPKARCATGAGPARATRRCVHSAQTMSPQDYVQQKATASGSSFYYAFLFLPAERRAAITAFYAFCREVDDVVDEVSDAGIAATKLAWWRGEVAQAFAGTPSHPVTQALMPLAPTFGIEARHLQAVIDGCQMDLEQNRYLDFANLQRYCHLVAGIVGEVAARIFGQREAGTTDYAHR